MNVLRQHEIELDRLIAELEFVVGKVNKLIDNMPQLSDEVSQKKGISIKKSARKRKLFTKSIA